MNASRTKLVSEVDDTRNESFLQNAAALLFPIDWPEPFGLVMIEAIACGTPVIAFRRGSVPEVIEDGVTGFVVANEDEAVAAVTLKLDRRGIRAAFHKRFIATRMAHDYVRCYRKLTKRNGAGREGSLTSLSLRPSSCPRGLLVSPWGASPGLAPMDRNRWQGRHRDQDEGWAWQSQSRTSRSSPRRRATPSSSSRNISKGRPLDDRAFREVDPILFKTILRT
jgi:Glycosyl transferases group 1